MAKAKTAADPTATKKKSPAKSTKNGSSSVETQAASSVDLAEEIRQRAYELYAERGFTNGNPEEDWLRAEAEVRARYPRSA
jgi:hypothetical protein